MDSPNVIALDLQCSCDLWQLALLITCYDIPVQCETFFFFYCCYGEAMSLPMLAFAALHSSFPCFRVPSFLAVRLPSNLLLISLYLDLLASASQSSDTCFSRSISSETFLAGLSCTLMLLNVLLMLKHLPLLLASELPAALENCQHSNGMDEAVGPPSFLHQNVKFVIIS